MVAQTRTAAAAAPARKLAFSDKLVGKALSTDALLKKLRTLHTELAELDQELVDVPSLAGVRTQLTSTSLLLHKDRGVKAYTACCLADILRLYAPDAPYTQNELKDIFQFFFRQLSAGLKATESPYYNEYFHLIESLSTVKSVVLVCDLPHADDLMAEIFRDLFALVRRDLAKKIELFIADILVALIDECQSLPSDVLETIMAQFMDKNSRLEQPAYRLAVQICNATADKLQRHVCQYFTDIIITHSRDLDSDSDFDDIRTAHELVKQLSKACPSLLHSVIPQLEEELRLDHVQVRLIVTQALGDMFADKGGADLIRKYPTTWNAWLMRKGDKVSPVRLKLVESARGLLLNLPEHRETVEEMLQLKLLDPDEKVRAAVCKVYSQLDYETALHYTSEAQLRAIAGRGMDKKHAVRAEAMNALGKLYSLAYSEIEIGVEAALAHFAWIPQEILHISNMTSEAKAVAEQVIADYVLPLPSASTSSASTSKNTEVDEVAWTDRLLNTMQHLDTQAVNTILSMSGIKAGRPTMYEHYLQACIQNNGGVIDENEDAIIQRLNNVIRHLSRQFPDPQKAAEDLNEFARANENRLYKLLKTCVDPQSDLKSIVKASNEFLRRVEQSLESTLLTMTIFLRRATLRIVNQSSIPTLIKRVQKAAPSSKYAQQLLTFISKHCPTLYKPHVSELTKAITDERNMVLVEVGMHALAALAKSNESQASLDKRTLERIMKFALGENPKTAKFAARLLASLQSHEDACVEIIESISEKLPEAAPEKLVAHVTVLAQMARFKPDVFKHKSDAIMAFLVKKLLMDRRTKDSDEMDIDDDWVEDEDVPPIQKARVLALKVCRNRCLANASAENAVELATPALRMFLTLLEHSGSFSADAPDSSPVKSRMRLQAAVSLLHLSTVEGFANVIYNSFIWLAIMVQDPCYHVRMNFLTKLVSLLTARKLSPRFNTIPFLTIHDPEADIRDRAVAYISFVSKSIPPAARVDQLEIIFIRLLHLLAHHPDFSTAHENMQEMAKYIDFYLDMIVTSDNIALLFHLAMKAKTVRDSASHTYSENLYTMSELAQELIKARAQARSWILQSYPGKIKLPSDILRALPNPEAVTKVIKTQYLSDATIKWLKEMRGPKSGAASKEKKREPKEMTRDGKSPPAKRKASRARTNGTNKRAKTTQKSARWTSDQSEDEDDEPSATDDDDDDGRGGESATVLDPSEKATSPKRSSSVVSETGGEHESDEDGGGVKQSERGKKFGRKARSKAQEKISHYMRKSSGSRPRKS